MDKKFPSFKPGPKVALYIPILSANKLRTKICKLHRPYRTGYMISEVINPIHVGLTEIASGKRLRYKTHVDRIVPADCRDKDTDPLDLMSLSEPKTTSAMNYFPVLPPKTELQLAAVKEYRESPYEISQLIARKLVGKTWYIRCKFYSFQDGNKWIALSDLPSDIQKLAKVIWSRLPNRSKRKRQTSVISNH